MMYQNKIEQVPSLTGFSSSSYGRLSQEFVWVHTLRQDLCFRGSQLLKETRFEKYFVILSMNYHSNHLTSDDCLLNVVEM
jgi:hypothetical protein